MGAVATLSDDAYESDDAAIAAIAAITTIATLRHVRFWWLEIRRLEPFFELSYKWIMEPI
jgi:hypothetical protein